MKRPRRRKHKQGRVNQVVEMPVSHVAPASVSGKPSELATWELPQLQNAIAFVAKQDQIVWIIFGAFWTANCAIMVALFQTGDLPKHPIGFIIAGVGASVSFIWLIIQRRAISYLGHYESVVDELEKKIGIEKQNKLAGLRSSGIPIEGYRVRPIMLGCPFVITVLWTLTLCALLIQVGMATFF